MGGVHGLKEHVVRLVAVEYEAISDHVIIPLLHVEAHPAEAIVSMKKHAINFVAEVSD